MNMKNKFKKIVSGLLIGIFSLSIGGLIANATQNFTPVQVTQPSYLKLGIGPSDTSIRITGLLSNTTLLTMTNFGIKGYGTLDPNNSGNSETIDFTGIVNNLDGTETLTGVDRGISNVYPYTASVSNTHSHSANSIFVVSNTAQYYSNFLSNINDATITSSYIYSSTTPPRYDFDPVWGSFSNESLASVAYVNSVAFQGAPTSTESIAGISRLATKLQQASTTDLGANIPLVLQAKYATSSPGSNAGLFTLILQNDGKISQNALNGTLENYTFNASTTLAATTTIAASSTTTAPLILNGIKYGFPSSQAASTTLATDGQGNLTWSLPNWDLIATTTLSGSIATTTLSFPARQNIMILVNASESAAVGGGVLNLQFNSDTTATYGANYTTNNGSLTAVAENTLKNIVLNGSNGTVIPATGGLASLIIDIPYNIAAQRKLFDWRMTLDGGAALATPFVSGAGVWNNSSAPITSVSIGAGFITSGSPTLQSGTSIQVYGSKI